MSKHTPGPWHTDDAPEHAIAVCTNSGETVADVFPNADAQSGVTTYANARLIAAAPELLEALKDLAKRHATTVKECGGCDHSVGICWCDDIRALDDANAAIAKATGEQ